ncbi:MAG: DMT family transporter [Pseudomonadota bacterium]
MREDRPLIGILLMLCFCVVAPMSDALAKLLGGTVSLLVLLVVRFGVQAAILTPILGLRAGAWSLERRHWRLMVVRTALHIAGIALMFTALRFLPLADAIAIAFVMPFILLLMGHFILGEEVGSRRIVACIVGFIGTLLVIQPSFASVGAPALLPLGVAVIFAAFMLVTRMVARDIDPISLQAINGVMASAVLLPALGIAFALGLDRIEPGVLTVRVLWLLLALGLVGTLAHLIMSLSLRFAPASTLAPMQYLEIPVAAVVGWVMFRDFPNGLALAGIAITISAGLYIVFRERALSRGIAPTEQPQAPPAGG